MKKIIVIDPEKKFWKTLEKVVDTDTCEIVFLENGKNLMSKLKEDNFDLIILNLELPDKNGFVYCNQIKKDSNLKKIPVIITSSEKTEEDFKQHKKLKVRAQEYLRKPISASTLKEAIKQFLPDIIAEKKPSPKKTQENANGIAVEDFDEENIDKLLDETFVGLIEEEPKTPQPAQDNIQKQLDSLIDENLTLKQQIEELQKGSTADTKLKEENETLKKSLEEIQNELNRKKEEIKELNVQILALQKEKGFFEKENRDILMNITTLQADFDEKLNQQEKLIESLKNEKQDIEKELNTLKIAKQSIETELNSLKDKKQNLENQLTTLQNEITEKNKLIETIQKENAELKEKISVLTDKAESLTQQLSDISGEKSKLEQQLIKQNKMIETLQSDLSISKEAKTVLEETVFQLKEANTKTKVELQNYLRESEILKAQLTEAEEKAKKLGEKIVKIKLKINELKEEAEK